MQQVLVAVLVALALLQLVRPQVGAQETEDNHSTNSECGVSYMYCSTLLSICNMHIHSCSLHS